MADQREPNGDEDGARHEEADLELVAGESADRKTSPLALDIGKSAERLAAQMKPLFEQMQPIFERHRAMSEAIAKSIGPTLNAQAKIAALDPTFVVRPPKWLEESNKVAAAIASRAAAQLPKIDFSAFERLGKVWADALPPNWPDDIDVTLLEEAVYLDGLPLVWVPRASTLDKVLAVRGREPRLAVLRDHCTEVLDDCTSVLADVTHPLLAGQAPLAVAAVEALRGEHPEAAQALAVIVLDTVIRRFVRGRYAEVKDKVKVNLDQVFVVEIRQVVALAPVHVFLTEWWPSSTAPPPESLSRHVTIHHADTGHLHAGNALIAVMLMTSVLRACDEIACLGDVDAA